MSESLINVNKKCTVMTYVLVTHVTIFGYTFM